MYEEKSKMPCQQFEIWLLISFPETIILSLSMPSAKQHVEEITNKKYCSWM